MIRCFHLAKGFSGLAVLFDWQGQGSISRLKLDSLTALPLKTLSLVMNSSWRWSQLQRLCLESWN